MKALRALCALVLLAVLAACNRNPQAASERYTRSANKYYAQAHFKEASILYRRALQKNALNSDAWYRLGLCSMKASALADARRDFLRAFQLDPTNADAAGKLADIDMGAYSLNPQTNKQLLVEAGEVGAKLLKRDPDSFEGLRITGFLALTKGDVPEAIRLFEKAHRGKPGDGALTLALVQALAHEGGGSEAEKYALASLDLDGHYGPLYDFLYGQYMKSGRKADAESLLTRKIAANPGQGPYLVQLAVHYYLTNRKADMDAVLTRLTSDPKRYPNGPLLAGDLLFGLHDLTGAIKEYEHGLAGGAQDKSSCAKKMAEALALQGHGDRAVKVIDDLVKRDPGDLEAAAMAAFLRLRGSSKSSAQTVIDQLSPMLAKLPPDDRRRATLDYNLGRAYAIKGDAESLEHARTEFREALKIKGDMVPAKLALTQLELARGDAAAALKLANEVLAIDPANLPAHLMKSSGLLKMGETSSARRELTGVLANYPQANDARYQLAILEFAARNYKESEAQFEQLVKANDPRGLLGIVDCKVRQKQNAAAEALLKDGLARMPGNSAYRFALANFYYNDSHFAAAAAEFGQLLEAHPNTPGLYIRQGEAKRMAGDLGGAAACFKKARDLNPTDAAPALQLGLLMEAAGRSDEARKLYEEVLRLQPDNFVALNNLAYYKADEGVDLDSALAFAERARQKRPNDPSIIDTLSLIYIRKNLTDDSLRLLGELVAREPRVSTFHLHLAMALYQKGERPEARKELETALRNGPSAREQNKIRELLAKIG